MQALFGRKVVGVSVRWHGTSPWELPQRPSPDDRHAGKRESISLSVNTRCGVEMTKNVKRIPRSSRLAWSAVETVLLTRLESLGESARVFPREVRGAGVTHRVTFGPRMISAKPEISARRTGCAKCLEI